MKKLLAVILIALLMINPTFPLANGTEYSESPAYADLADKISGCEYIGAFVDYKSLIDPYLKQLLSMSSAQRQQLVTEILSSAGVVYVSEESVDFTDSELSLYLAYAVANVAEAKSYLKHFGISSITDVPLTVHFGGKTEATVSFFRSFLPMAYNSGISDILIRNNDVGVMLDIAELGSILTKPTFSLSLMNRKAEDLNDEYKNAVKSDVIYQLILSEEDELYNVLPDSKVLFYNCVDSSRAYCLASDADGVRAKPVSTSYDGDIVYAPVNGRRWFGIYKEELLPSGGFADVQSEHWAYDYIDYLAISGTVTGIDGKFNPDDNVTREEYVKMLVDSLGLVNPDARCSFSDTAENQWHYKYIASAFDCGIINGTKSNVFGVGECVTRQDIAVMTVRALNYKQITLEPALSHFGYFFDSDAISDYAQEAVMTMYVAGFISGDEDYLFNPHSPATRAEVAKIIYMVIDYLERI